MIKKTLLIIILIILICFIEIILMDYSLLIDYAYLDTDIVVDGYIINDINNIDFNFTLKTSTMRNQEKSEVLNCVYISRYMGQDWNKRFFYIDPHTNLSPYCEYIIAYLKDTLSVDDPNETDIVNLENRQRRYYSYINDLILHARECIDLTGDNDRNKCVYLERVIDMQADIKKNMCLNSIEPELCNHQKVHNSTPLINGYTDRNMITFGRDFYSKNKNYSIITNLNKVDLDYIKALKESENVNFVYTFIIVPVFIITAVVLLYSQVR